MARPIGSVRAICENSISDLREEFLTRARAKNLSPRTIEWYERHTLAFVRWAAARELLFPWNIDAGDLDEFLVSLHASGAAPNSVRGAAQVLKTLMRFGIRKGRVPADILADFTLPKVPQVIIETFSDDQLRALLKAPDRRRWIGLRDYAILMLLLDTMARVSEVTGLDAGDVDIEDRCVRVLGKGRKVREIPFGQVTAQAMRRYARAVADARPTDPFFISGRGRRLAREDMWAMVSRYGDRAGIEGIRCSPHTLRHTGAKRFILNGGDVFTLQKLLGHTSLVMVRRYVELASVDVRRQHERFSPADSLLRRPSPLGRTFY